MNSPEGIPEFAETRSITLEWKVTNLKHLFESTKGESKSRCIKSAMFDHQRWQVFFYPNSGHDQFCSVYLSCEPTALEKSKGMFDKVKGGSTNAPDTAYGSTPAQIGSLDVKNTWKREGKYKFTFEAKSIDKRSTFKVMEAVDHTFSSNARNWGYQNFLKRSDAYFNNQLVRLADAFLIICTIESSPTAPSPPPIPRLLIPPDLVNAYASLFNDPHYSDVCFRIKSRTGRERRLYAAKKVLAGRSEYFDTMFSSGFYESEPMPVSLPPSPTPYSRANNDVDPFDFELDEDEDETDEEYGNFEDPIESDTDSQIYHEDEQGGSETPNDDQEQVVEETSFTLESEELFRSTTPRSPMSNSEFQRNRADSEASSFADAASQLDGPSPSPVKISQCGDQTTSDLTNLTPIFEEPKRSKTIKAKPKLRRLKKKMITVEVTDATYTTFKALLLWLYTDAISFAPLASGYHVAREKALQQGVPFPYATRREFIRSVSTNTRLTGSGIELEMEEGQAASCSAKAIYRLSDKIGLPDLKERAYEHIVKNLTVENIPYEVFGSFALHFEEVRKVEIAFLCDKWNEVRSSPSMQRVIANIRIIGRFPGFEEVWAKLLPSLEYRPILTAEPL